MLRCVGDRNNTIREPQWYAWIDIKMVYFDYVWFLSEVRIYETVSQRHNLIVVYFADEARMKDPTKCIQAACPILVDLLRLEIYPNGI